MKPAGNGDRLRDQIILVNVHAGNRRPPRMRQHGAKLTHPCRRDARAHELKPERFVRLRGECGMARHRRRPAAHHEPVADLLGHGRRVRRHPKMHGYR